MKDESTSESNSGFPDQKIVEYLAREPGIGSDKNKAIILLHGVGSNESVLFNLAGQLPDDCWIIAPRGQFSLGNGRFAWYQVDFSGGRPVINKAQELSSRIAIRKFIEQVKQKFDIGDLYLGGFSQGAIMSYTIGLTEPGLVQAVIALSGRILDEIRPMAEKNPYVRKLKVFVAHGRQDATLPVRYAREARAYLEQLNIPVSYHEYDVGHRISPEEISDLNAWIRHL